jgi:UDP-N-acetylmuramoyl-tripeptide--D-alanyl-D-alanine ligase
MIWTSKEAAIATQGKTFSNWVSGKIVFDSRLIEVGDTFLALPGANSDGHDHIEMAFNKGAAAAIVERIPEGIDTKKLLLVKSSTKALNDLAHYKRSKSKAIFIAITGSVGKTSTKELLSLAFSAHGKTFSSRGNYNNYLGVPINLASMPNNTKYAIIEIGMDHANEITPLTKMVKPNIAIITGIEHIHQANFSSIEGIAEAKAEIFLGLKYNSTAIINSQSNCYDLLNQHAVNNPNITRIINIGKDSKIISYKIENNNTKSELNILNKKTEVNLDGIVGIHQIHNIVITLSTIESLGLNIKESNTKLEKFELPQGRGKISHININNKNITLIDDSYNAGPVSIKAALKNMSNYTGRKIAILGDMVDMGPNSLEMHLALKDDIIENNIDKVICFGKQMKHLQETLPDNKQYGHYISLKELAKDLPIKLKSDDILLIKGSFYLTKLYHFTQHLREGTLDAL